MKWVGFTMDLTHSQSLKIILVQFAQNKEVC